MQDFRQAMVRTAIEMLPTHGHAGITLIHVARACGAPRGSLYHYFPGGKDELMDAVLDGTQAFGLGVLLSAAAAAQTPAAFTASIAQSLGDWLAAAAFRSGCPVAALSMSVPLDHPLHARCAAIYAAWTAQLAQDLERHGVPAARAPALASTMLNLFEGALLEARLRKSRAPLEGAAEVALGLMTSAGGRTQAAQ